MECENKMLKNIFFFCSVYLLNFKVNAHDDQVVGSLFTY